MQRLLIDPQGLRRKDWQKRFLHHTENKMPYTFAVCHRMMKLLQKTIHTYLLNQTLQCEISSSLVCLLFLDTYLVQIQFSDLYIVCYSESVRDLVIVTGVVSWLVNVSVSEMVPMRMRACGQWANNINPIHAV